MENSEVLRGFLIPFTGNQALLPNSSLVEVLPFATPLKLENAPPWVAGTILWRAFNVPLVSLKRLIDPAEPRTNDYSRIVMINTLGHDPGFPYLGLLGTDAPRLLAMERPQITVNTAVTQPPKREILCWVIVNGREACIPDLNALEATLGPLMRQQK